MGLLSYVRVQTIGVSGLFTIAYVAVLHTSYRSVQWVGVGAMARPRCCPASPCAVSISPPSFSPTSVGFGCWGGFVSTLRPRVSAALGHRFGVAFVGCCSLHRLWGCFRWLRSLASSGLGSSPLPLVGGAPRPVTALARHKLPRSGTTLAVK